MTRHRITSATTEDGERIVVYGQRDAARKYGMAFHTTFTDQAAQIAREVSSGATLRLFIVLPQMLSYTAFKRLDQVKLGAELSMNHSTISRSLKELVALGVVERQGKGPMVEWRLSPNFGWRGNVESFHAERAKRGEQPAPKGEQPPPIIAEYIFPKAPQRDMRLFAVVNNKQNPDTKCKNSTPSP
jgi:hypothetical protein